MHHTKTLSLSTLAASLVLLAGCVQTQTASNTNIANDNAAVEVVTNTNETVVNENTNSEQGNEVDTNDWLTYTNEEYGFSFRYPAALHVTDKTSIQSGERYKLLLTLSESYDPNSEDFGVDVWQINLIDRYDSAIKAISNDPNQEIVSEVNNSSMSKTIMTRNKTSDQTKVQTFTESNDNVISFTCAEWSDEEICIQISSTLQLL